MADVKMPQLGESVTEGTLGKWLKEIGDPVAKYEPLVEVVTDKVTAEIPSDFEGTLTEILVLEGATVHVGTIVCRVQEANPSIATVGTSGTPANRSVTTEAPRRNETTQISQGDQRGRFSPAVLKLAQEHQVDLSLVPGTGEGGRITRRDVLVFLEQGLASRSFAPSPTSAPTVGTRTAPQNESPITKIETPVSSDPLLIGDEVTVIDPPAVRKMIAKRMVESKHTAPHAWTMVEADVTELVQFRAYAKNDFHRREGVELTYLPFVIKAVAEALKQYPMLNAAWVNDQIHVFKNVNISIAIATDDALVVPVIHNADRLSIAGLAHAARDLAVRARSGRLAIADVHGGTFTVNNTGAFGSILSQPIINTPQAAIMTMESIVKRPVVIGDAIAIRSMVNLCLSLDHRLLDGWVSGQFLKSVKNRLETFGMDTVLY